MQNVHVPGLYCPEETRISPFIDRAEKETYEWVKRFQLADEAALERYKTEKFVHMTARFYPWISPGRLGILSQLFTLLFIADDGLDHAECFKNADYLKAFAGKFMAVPTKGQHFSLEDGEPILAAWTELWGRIKLNSTSQWQHQFIASLTEMYRAAFWENANQSKGQQINLQEYLQLRQYLGAANIATDCIEFAYPNLQLSQQMKEDSLIKRMTELSRNTVCWANDLFSLGKEFEHGGAHNLVLLIQNKEGISLEAAIDRAGEIHDSEVQLFYSLWQEAVQREDMDNHTTNVYIEALACFMKGNIDWSVMDTYRYYNFSYAKSKQVKLPILVTSH